MRPAPLKVGFNIGADGSTGFETEASQRMANGVILPLLVAVEDSRAKNGRRKEIFTLRDVTEAVRAAIGRKSKPETDHWPHRNSIEGRYVRGILASPWRVGCGCARYCSRTGASRHEHADVAARFDGSACRLALYESAKYNFFVANGPYTLALFGTRPFLKFNAVDGGDRYAQHPEMVARLDGD